MSRSAANGPFRGNRRTPVGLNGLLTIDTGPELSVETLQNMRAFYGNEKTHDTLREAMENVAIAFEQQVEANIIGHGHQGVVNTGRGNDFETNDPSKFLGVKNEEHWTEEITRLRLRRRLNRLTICACDTGGGKPGADLVFMLAKQLGAIVRAPTGRVWAELPCCEPQLDDDAVWQCAHPDDNDPPPPLFPPMPVRVLTDMRLLSIFDRHMFVPVPVESVTTLRCRTREHASLFPPVNVDVERSLAREAVGFARFDSPFLAGSVPTTFITGSFFVAFEVLGRTVVREFRIHNDSLLQDVLYRNVYYHIDFQGFIAWSASL
jgi:hypothetical protein